MAGSLQCGQIIWAEIADARGIPKSRPAVIITPDDQITPGGTFQIVATVSQPLGELFRGFLGRTGGTELRNHQRSSHGG